MRVVLMELCIRSLHRNGIKQHGKLEEARISLDCRTFNQCTRISLRPDEGVSFPVPVLWREPSTSPMSDRGKIPVGGYGELRIGSRRSVFAKVVYFAHPSCLLAPIVFLRSEQDAYLLRGIQNTRQTKFPLSPTFSLQTRVAVPLRTKRK